MKDFSKPLQFEDLSGIEYAAGIERLLDPAHQPDFRVRAREGEVAALLESDAVLSGSPAGKAGDESSCCVSSSEKVPMQERGVCPLWRRPGGRAGRNPRKPHPAARRVTAQAR